MVSITEGSQERRHSTKRGDEEKSTTQEENCNTFEDTEESRENQLSSPCAVLPVWCPTPLLRAELSDAEKDMMAMLTVTKDTLMHKIHQFIMITIYVTN